MAIEKKRILLIDDEAAVCRMVEAILTDRGYAVVAYNHSPEAVAAFAPRHYDAVITDVKMPVMDGLEVLQRIKEQEPAIPVIVITAHATVDMSIHALRKGAYDILSKPFEPEELLSRIRNALRETELLVENRELKKELAFRSGTMVGNAPKLLVVLETARKVAARDIPVLITGESGTGKELVARAIHEHSPRKERKFVAINCGAIPEALLESELFGHRKGAFTGADRDHKGLIETADGGTLFLDEVGTLPLTVQKTLLRFLQEQEFYRVGDATPSKVDVRVLSATNLDLQAAVQAGSFREDLYYRLNVVNVRLPPLRERRSDIPLLVAHLVKEQNEQFGTQVKGFTREAMEALYRFHWPGNIRQLRNVIQAAMAIDNSDRMGLEILAQLIELPDASTPDTPDLGKLDYAAELARFETDYLNRLLQKTGGNIEDMAQQAGMNIATIYRKVKKYGLR
jgi:DNA-binding NtrC family response regulator